MRCYGTQTFFKAVRGVYYSECGRVKLCRTQCGNWVAFIDGRSIEGRWWGTLREAAYAVAVIREMEG